MRIGQGCDLHRLTRGRKLYLGGVEIPSELGEEAHSDGDVLIHAIIDSLFGALAMGDIGSHFPPSDMQYKDIPSLVLLARTLDITKAEIINLDCTVVLERPKLRPYIDAIRASLADALGIDVSRVSVKAKTNEGVDSEGRMEAISAQATVLLAND